MATPYADGTRNVKCQSNPLQPPTRIGGLTDVDLLLYVGGGSIPLVGRFNQRYWAACLGTSEETFRDRVKEHGVKHKRDGRDIYVDAADYWAALPDG
jgi:hypothetical protein